MAPTDRINCPVRSDRGCDVERRPLRAAGNRRRHGVRAGRPGKLTVEELSFAWILRTRNGLALNRCRRQQDRIAYLADRVVRGHPDQPGIYDILAVEACAGGGDLDHVVVYVSRAVSSQRRGGERVGINFAERIDALHDRTVRTIQLEDRAPSAWIVDEAVSKHRVIDWFPEIVLRSWCLPIGVEGPHLYELTVLPREPVLMPRLRAVGSRAIGTRLRFHKHIVAIDQGHLVMNKKRFLSLYRNHCLHLGLD